MKNTSKVWKEFQKNELTHSAAHYLLAILDLHRTQGYARLSDVATKLNISKGSLSTSLKSLLAKGIVLEDENKHLSLSANGLMLAEHIENTFSVTETFLEEVLGVSHKQAEVDACKIEHLISPETSGGLLKMYKAIKNDPKLAKQLKAAMKKYENCSIDGCKSCKKRTFCVD
jgi:DtxR family Mn-dependent transcriptional regulator